MKSTIDVSRRNLCCGCGNCVSVCPASALTLERNRPRVPDSAKCNYCGACLKVCPSINELKKPSVHKCYSAYSRNTEIRLNASSGGFVTQLLIDLLDQQEIDGAIVCDYKDDIFAPQAVLAKSTEEIIKASTSKYCPVAMNLVLGDLGNGRFAFVGLPCHIKGLRLRQNIDVRIDKSVTLAIGLFCNHTPKFEATDYLLYNLGVNKKDVTKIQYRGNGWPGVMQVTLRDNRVLRIAKAWETGFGRHFIPNACLNCRDMFADYADISVGDPWLKEYESDTLGTSFVITRHESATQMIEASKGLSIDSVGYSKVFASQQTNYANKMQRHRVRRRRLLSVFGNYRFLWRLLFVANKMGTKLRKDDR